MQTFLQWLDEKAFSHEIGDTIKGVKWIYHPKLKTVSDQCDPSNHYKYEHSHLIDRGKKDLPMTMTQPNYDDIHKGHAYIKNGTAHVFSYHNRVHHQHNNALDPVEVGDHIKHKYGLRKVVWHNDGMDAQDAVGL